MFLRFEKDTIFKALRLWIERLVKLCSSSNLCSRAKVIIFKITRPCIEQPALLCSPQKWPKSLFQIPTPPLLQNFWIRIWVWVRKFSNLKIRLLFRLRLPYSIQAKFTHVFTYEMTMQTPVTAEMEKWLRVRFFTNFLLRVWTVMKNAESCHSRQRHSVWCLRQLVHIKQRLYSFNNTS